MTRDVRDSAGGNRVTLCNCLRDVVRESARDVREVTMQVIDNIAGGEPILRHTAPLYTTYITRPRLLARRAGIIGVVA